MPPSRATSKRSHPHKAEQRMDTGIAAINEHVKEASAFAYRLREQIGTVIVGQRYLVDRLLVGLLANGHVLLEGGPIFAHVILADEINRAPAKVQSALLEAMQEHQVTIGDETHLLPEPFLVLATQNPIEQEGTYPLPEAQVDRFMLKLRVGYPSREEERQILDRMAVTTNHRPVAPVASTADILGARSLV